AITSAEIADAEQLSFDLSLLNGSQPVVIPLPRFDLMFGGDPTLSASAHIHVSDTLAIELDSISTVVARTEIEAGKTYDSAFDFGTVTVPLDGLPQTKYLVAEGKEHGANAAAARSTFSSVSRIDWHHDDSGPAVSFNYKTGDAIVEGD